MLTILLALRIRVTKLSAPSLNCNLEIGARDVSGLHIRFMHAFSALLCVFEELNLVTTHQVISSNSEQQLMFISEF